MLATGVALAVRPPFPVDETRYLSVAWEMWSRGGFLVPHLNGEPYSDKPPLLFWLFHLGWVLFGVNEWWPRLVAPLFGLASLGLTARLARRLWPDDVVAVRLAPWWLLGTALWLFFLTPTLFDMALTGFALLGIYGLVIAAAGRPVPGWTALAAAIGLGLLTKGPVILLHVLPAAVFAPGWVARRPVSWPRWYLSLAVALSLGVGLALLWAIPAARAGGDAYGQAILWGQTAGRVVSSFAHARPWWWYLALLPVFVLPWSLWPVAWRAFARLPGQFGDHGARLCLVWSGAGLLGLSLISGKQPHYLLPLLPAGALLASRLVSSLRDVTGSREALPVAAWVGALGVLMAAAAWDPLAFGLPVGVDALSPAAGIALVLTGLILGARPPRRTAEGVKQLTAVMVALFVIGQWAFVRPIVPAYDLRELAHHLARVQADGVALATVGKYHGQFQFLGRLTRPLEVLPENELPAWLAAHPNGRVVLHHARHHSEGDPAQACAAAARWGALEQRQRSGAGEFCVIAPPPPPPNTATRRTP